MISLFAFAPVVLHSQPVQQSQLRKVRFGKYSAEIRLPEGGLYAQEEIDLEFRVVDTTQKDPVEEGFKGVGGIDASATITMPSMPGMPVVKPSVHREGVPGDYGIVAYFAHGGQYKIDLKLKIPGDGLKNVGFLVDVKDERPTKVKKQEPFSLRVLETSKMAEAGKPMPLRLQIVNTKTKKVETSFDEAHTKKFHLLIASKDLNWFVHEHPTMQPNGNWAINQTFPAGGEYWIYADVAPAGQGSRILISKIKVSGPKPNWDTRAKRQTVATDRGLTGTFGTLKPIQIGRVSTVQIKLFDEKTKKLTQVTEQWLGAIGHLMIISKDGQTVVHSHPLEDAASEAMAKRGLVRFSARFPKPGYYKAYAQFMWHGSVRTLGFGLEVK